MVPAPIIVVSPPVVVVGPSGDIDITDFPSAESPGLREREEPAARFPVMGAEVFDRWIEPESAGYSFEDNSVEEFNDDDVDLMYDGQAKIMKVPTDTDIQDLGPSNGVKEGLRIDKYGWAPLKSVEVNNHHQYALWLWNGDLVKLYVQEIRDDDLVFDWMPGGSMTRRLAEDQVFGR
jgi:hypothetical protein